MAEILFWCGALMLAHTYFFYPLILVAWDTVSGGLRQLKAGPARTEASLIHGDNAAGRMPTVSLVVAAYNEESCIEQKLQNSLSLAYPPERFEVLIGSDGSTDGTNEIVQSQPDPRVRLSLASRAGKTSVLNRCIPTARGEIVVLSDANTMIDPKAVEKLVRHFDDPSVGAVCGRLRLFNPSKRDYEESAYWNYESFIKLYEGKRGAVMGANGGLYAIRKSLFVELPPSTIVDDFVIPMQILARGFKVLYEPAAVASEETTEDYQKEFGRRARIAAGNFQSLRMLPSLLSPSAGFKAFAFWSHKVVRWCAPALMALCLLANLFLLDQPFYKATFAAQLAFYGLAVAGKAALFTGALRRVSQIAYYFVTMNAAIAVGFWRFMRNTQRAAWDRTARAA